MNKHVTIDKLNEHLFEAIEMLKNNRDKEASENEKMDIETAKAIADLAKVAVDGFKVKVQTLQILSKAENVNAVKSQITEMGIYTDNKVIDKE